MAELNPRLAEAVTWWVQRNALTQTVIAARGGPSTTSMTKILAGKGSVRPGSLTDLDVGLGWGDGVAVEYLSGRDPLGIFSLPTGAPPAEWTDDQLLAELRRRLAAADERRGGTDGTTPEAGKKTSGGGDPDPVKVGHSRAIGSPAPSSADDQ